MSYAEGYVDVAARIAEFYAKYPDGSLQMDPPEWVTMDGASFIMARAYAYRTPDDVRPGIGSAWEAVPGRTPYTRGSELMNLETSAWGRALAALGIATKQGIATAQEIASAEARRVPIDQTHGTPPPNSYTKPSPLVSEKQLGYLRKIMREQRVDEYVLADFVKDVLGFELPHDMGNLTKTQASKIIDGLTKKIEEKKGPIEDPWIRNGETNAPTE